MGHARALAGIKDDAKKKELAKLSVANGWSVRELEDAVQQPEAKGKAKPKPKSVKRDPYLEEIEETLREKFKTTVRIKPNKDKGHIELAYYGKGDLERLLEILQALA